jgi:RNA polymerase sigma-70 factor (ECF subfamily)
MSSVRFPTTAWSVIRAAQDQSSEGQLEAMNRCIAAYWRPVFCFLRAKEYPFHNAEDLTQEFFFQFFRREWIRRADEQRGRFRNFLLAILKRFLADQKPDRTTRQKAFDDRLLSISTLVGESDRTYEPPDNRTPEQIFMQQWAHSVIAAVQQRLETWCNNRGRPDWFRVFCEVHLRDPASPRVSQQALADALHITREQVRYGVDQTHQQFVDFLQAEIADQVESTEDIESEIRELDTLLYS